MTPPSGALPPAGVAALLRPLVRDQRTGLLKVTTGRVARTVYVVEGRVIFATSTDPDDRLGEMLVRKGLISYRALEESVKGIQTGRRQGAVLVERGDIAARDLLASVVEQVQEIVFTLFRVDEGAYEFREGPLPSREVVALRMSTPELVMEGVRRMTSWSRLRAGVGPLEQRYRLGDDSSSRLAATRLVREELNLVAAIDGTMSVEEICAALPESDFLVCRGLLGLWAAGLVDRVPQDTGDEAGVHHTEPGHAAPEATVSEELDRFNERHRFVYELVRHELRDGARGFLERAFVRAAAEFPRLFEGVAVDAAGELDALALRRNIVGGGIARFGTGLDRLLEIELELARELVGDARAAIIADGLLALREHQLHGGIPST